MKKKIITIALLIFGFGLTVNAQNLTSKKGETILPEEGDYAIGFDADPFLNYVGNFLNQAGNNAPQADFTNNNLAIVGKMFKDAQTAYRGRVRLGFGSNAQTSSILNDDGSGGEVEDKRTFSYNNITLGAGLEKRKGNTRIQGFYGGEALINLQSNSVTTEFGNEMQAGGARSTTSFNSGNSAILTSRQTSSKSGTTIGLAARGFVGAEIFVFPKLSIAMEYGWGLRVNMNGMNERETEVWNGSAVEKITDQTVKSTTFGIDTDNNGGALTILFHF